MSCGSQPVFTLFRNAVSSALVTRRMVLNRSSCCPPNRSISTSDDPIHFAIRAIESSARQTQLTPAEIWAQRSADLDLPPPLDPYAGRRIPVTTDLRGAFLKLSRRLKRNFVFKEWKLSIRHEKRGVKRNRLRSERWRKLFANEVRRKVQLVSAIRRRG